MTAIPLARGTPIRRLAFDSTGRFLAAGTTHELRIWDLSSRDLVFVSSEVEAFAFSPVSPLIAVATRDGRLVVRRVPTWKERTSVPTNTASPPSLRQAVSDVAVTPDGSLVIVARTDGLFDVWSVETGERTLQLHTGEVRAFAVDPRQEWVIIRPSLSRQGLRALSLRTGQEIPAFFGVEARPNPPPIGMDQVAVSAGREIYAQWVGRLLTWKASDDEADPASVVEHKRVIGSFAIDPVGRHLATGQVDGSIALWDAGRRKILEEWAAHEPLGVFGIALAWAPDGARLASGGSDGFVRLWCVRR